MDIATTPGFAPSRLLLAWNVLKEQGLLRFLDSLVYVLIRNLRRRFYRWNAGPFGLKEAFYWGSVDKWHRYNAVLTRIDQLTRNETSTISILEVGCGSEGLVEFYPRLNGDLYVVDSLDPVLSDSLLRRKYPKPFNPPTRGDARDIPLDDNSRDFVISIDSLEHVPDGQRGDYLRELLRVAKRGVLFTCPMQSAEGNFLGRTYDAKLQDWHVDRFGKPNPTITEHLEFGEPSVSKLHEVMPGVKIDGVMNAEAWLKCMTLSNVPLLGHLTGIWFLISGRNNAAEPPYYGGMAYLEK